LILLGTSLNIADSTWNSSDKLLALGGSLIDWLSKTKRLNRGDLANSLILFVYFPIFIVTPQGYKYKSIQSAAD
jgi:hypothetical protein